MSSIYRTKNYIQAMEILLENRRKTGAEKLTLAGLAREMGVQPSYLTNVMKGRGHLNQDQLFAFTQTLQVSEKETEYLQLLLEYGSSGLSVRKKQLEEKIKAVQNLQSRPEKNLKVETPTLPQEDQERYYLDPFILLTHVLLSVGSATNQMERVRSSLGISGPHMRRILNTLESIGYIRPKGNGYEVVVKGRHLPKESPLSGPQLALMRIRSVDQLFKLTPEEKYSFSATFSADEEVFTKIRAEFTEFLTRAQKLSASASTPDVFQMNFDLFPWTQKN